MKIRLGQFDYYIKSIFLFLAYFTTAKLGLEIDAVSGFATLVWLPTGISLAAIFIMGFKFWPAIVLGAFVTNLTSGAPYPIAAGIGLGNGLEAFLGAYMLKLVRFRMEMERIQDVVRLVCVVFASTLVSATIGTTSLVLGNIVHPQAYFNTWSAWWVGDTISGLVISPLIFVWVSRSKITLNQRRLTEEFAALAILVLVGMVALDIFLIDNKSLLGYLVFPPLTWIALRFSQRTTVTALFFLFLIVIYFAIGESRSQNSVNEELFLLQSFIGITAVTIMLLSAAILERKAMEKKKDEFISVASHELRTPLTSIKLFGWGLQKEFEKRGDKKSLSHIVRLNDQVTRLSRLVFELFDISKIQEGKMQLNKKKVQLGRIDTGSFGRGKNHNGQGDC